MLKKQPNDAGASRNAGAEKGGKHASGKKNWKLSITPVLRYHALFCALMAAVVAAGGILLASVKMTERATSAARSLEYRLHERVGQSVRLLEFLASDEKYADPSRPVKEKVDGLEKVNGHFGYMMIRYVDQDINVHSSRGATNLSSRDYLRRLFSTGRPQVTDSFAAGADGATLNYTIAVPLTWKGETAGCLFCAIYFEEIEETLRQQARSLGVDAFLLGSQNHIMSATSTMLYGTFYPDSLKGRHFPGTTGADIETALLNRREGAFWSAGNGDIRYTAHVPVRGTGWTLVCSGDLASTYATILPLLIPVMLGCALLLGGMTWLVNRHLKS